VDVPDARLAERARQSIDEEVADQRMCAGDVAGVRAAAAEEAMALTLLDEGTGVLLGNVGGDGAEDKVDRLQDRGAHQEVLEVVGKVADDLLGEVLVQMPLGAAERRDECADLRRVALVEGSANELE
jgi:hypothetical protein